MAPLYLGSTAISKVYKGSTELAQNYVGDNALLSSTVQGGMSVYSYIGDRPTNAPKTGMGLSPDLIWAKDRGANDHWSVLDSNRGANVLSINNTDAQASFSGFTFDTDGFTVGSSGQMNSNGNSLVAFGWSANGGTLTNGSGTGVSNVEYQANTSKGFSIVTYTGSVTGGNKTFTHGLNSAPEYVIIKDYDWGVPSWFTWHTGLSGGDYFMRHESSVAETQNSTVFSSAPGSTYVNIGGDSGVGDRTDRYVAYCWHSVAGYSKFGSYTGNGSSQSITTGFQPDWLMFKRIDQNGWYWEISDTVRGIGVDLAANTSYAEQNQSPGNRITINTNGFTHTTANYHNISGASYIYAAFKIS